jgi:CheY-like chemotaxis protein
MSPESLTAVAGRAALPVALVVDDNAGMRVLIRALLADITSSVVECADGDSAVTIFERVRPDWVLMDISMAGVDGLAATRRIRASHPDARVVMVTEHGENAYREASMAAGAVGFVRKDALLDLPALLLSLPAAGVSA